MHSVSKIESNPLGIYITLRVTQFRIGPQYPLSDHLALFCHTPGKLLGGKCNIKLDHCCERFEVVWHNINPVKT